MLAWVDINKEWIVGILAFFSAGGAGTMILKNIFDRRRTNEQAKNQPPSEKDDSSITGRNIIIHKGRGDASIHESYPLNKKEFERVQNKLKLSPLEANRLVDASSETGTNLEDLYLLKLDNVSLEKLKKALDANDKESANETLRCIMKTASKQSQDSS